VSGAILTLEKLVVRYGDFVAVDGLDLEVRPGEVFGLLGPNGAGKSSTIRVLIGQRPPSAGRVTLAGLDVAWQWQQVKPLFGYVPDRENHFEELTGRQNLRLFADLYSVDRRRIDDCLALVELSDAADLPASAYSLGMRRKLLLARALLHCPKVLYLDEPTANLDVHSIEVVHRTLRDLAAGGTAMVLTTHNMREVEQVCDRVAVLCRGRLVALGSPLELRQRHAERLVDLVLADGRRLTLNLDEEAGRDELAGHVRAGAVADVRSRAFDFQQAFLKLTGQTFG